VGRRNGVDDRDVARSTGVMKNLSVLVLVGAAIVGAGCDPATKPGVESSADAPMTGAPTAAPAARSGPIALFNGKDLSGWTQRGGKAVYLVEGDAIVGETRPKQPNSFLCTDRDYSDFILELDFMVDPEANSGVQIRSESRPDYKNGVVHGYQVEIDPGERAWTGGIYDESRRGWLAPLDKNPQARAAFKQGQWNHFRIECRGDHFQTWLNGVACADLHDSMTPKGFIALQVHGVGDHEATLRVRWKNLMLTDLSEN